MDLGYLINTYYIFINLNKTFLYVVAWGSFYKFAIKTFQICTI